MKKILLTLAVIIPLALVGCKKTDTGTNTGGGDGGDKNPPTEEVTLDGYVEPITQFGISVHQLKELETHRLKTEKDTELAFEGEDMVDLYMYLLDDSYLLKSSAAMVSTAYSSVMGEFLAEKYVPIGVDTEDLNVYYVSKDLDIFVTAHIYSASYVLIMYLPYDKSSSVASFNSLPQMCGGVEPCDGDRMAIFEELVASIK